MRPNPLYTVVLFILFLSLSIKGYCQMPTWKKSIYIGSAVTVGGAGTLAAGSYLLAVSVPLFFGDNDDEGTTAAAAGMLAGGCILATAGLTFTITGPFIIKRGLKLRRQEKEGVIVGFAPVHNKLLDKYQCSLNNKKFATVSLTF